MAEQIDIHDTDAIMRRIQTQIRERKYRISDHAEDEMMEEETGRIRLSEIMEALENGRILENYPNANRGPCCLIYGTTENGRPLHVVCTTTCSTLFIITVYQPTSPKWTTPTKRGDQS